MLSLSSYSSALKISYASESNGKGEVTELTDMFNCVQLDDALDELECSSGLERF